ncbi:H-NS histone family protein [Caballeronia sp. J97]|uniref:H-NS histone family protein n=1 Tax=Caballeronia sp. J97 TaxID=2805429 RepID=UPI002AB2235B|nr:H-NS histone family protein [Caballeronia sp. J97]
MVTLAQLENQIQKLQRRADALRARESVQVIAKIRTVMDEYGLTTADLAKAGLGAANKRGRSSGPAKSAGPRKGAGKSKLPPKYRDPVSGATWSGHARPPAWIKDAPDRSVYLIGGASGKNGAAKGARRGRAASASRAAGAKRAGRASANKTARKSAQSAAA